MAVGKRLQQHLGASQRHRALSPAPVLPLEQCGDGLVFRPGFTFGRHFSDGSSLFLSWAGRCHQRADSRFVDTEVNFLKHSLICPLPFREFSFALWPDALWNYREWSPNMGFEATHTADTELPVSLGKSFPQRPLSRQHTQNDFKNQKFWCVLFVFCVLR